MFITIKSALDERIRPSLYPVPGGKRLVIMEAEDYLDLTGMDPDNLPLFVDEHTEIAVDAYQNVRNTEEHNEDSRLADRLLGLELDDEFRVDDLPL